MVVVDISPIEQTHAPLRYMELTSISGHNTSSPLKLGACGLQRNRQGLFRAKMNLDPLASGVVQTCTNIMPTLRMLNLATPQNTLQ
jgi:hypothetical protein